jgi:hypothetical protein
MNGKKAAQKAVFFLFKNPSEAPQLSDVTKNKIPNFELAPTKEA